MRKYLLDTNICVFFLRGKFDIVTKIKVVGEENCFVSEITIAELKFGVENGDDPIKVALNRKAVEQFIANANILPAFPAFDVYAKEKAKLKKSGFPLDDFDLLIGATAITNGLVMVTNNVKHLGRMDGIIIEDWTKNP